MNEQNEIVRALELSGEVLLITDKNGVIRYATPAITDLTGYTPTELIGQHTRIFKSSENPTSLYDDMWETILAKQVWSGLIRNRTKSGTEKLEYLSIIPMLGKDGDIDSFCCVRHHMDEAASANLRVPGNLLKKIPSDREEVLDFVSQMSYEFRTALNSILGFSQILYDDLAQKLEDSQKEYFNVVSQSSQRLLHIIEDVLFLTRIGKGEISFQFERIQVAHELKKILSSIMLLVKPGNVRFIKVIEDNGALISADLQCFEQIISNLLINAIKFTSNGTITVGLETKNEKAVISVIDTGVGITEEFKPYVFVPFKQEELGYNEEFEGAGLGLTITSKLIEMMDAEIDFESTKGEGSTFIVSFPIMGRAETDVTVLEPLQVLSTAC